MLFAVNIRRRAVHIINMREINMNWAAVLLLRIQIQWLFLSNCASLNNWFPLFFCSTRRSDIHKNTNSLKTEKYPQTPNTHQCLALPLVSKTTSQAKSAWRGPPEGSGPEVQQVHDHYHEVRLPGAQDAADGHVFVPGVFGHIGPGPSPWSPAWHGEPFYV